MKPILRNTIIFAVIGLIAGILSSIYQLSLLSQTDIDQLLVTYGSLSTLHIITGVQTMIFALVSALLGQNLIKNLPFQLYKKWHKKGVLYAILFGLISALLIVLSDAYVFASLLDYEIGTYEINVVYLLVGIIYGGIVEEVLMRLFILSLVVFIIEKITKEKNAKTIWTGIIISSLLFALGHIPAALVLGEFSVTLLIRILLLNTVPGILFGYIYMKEGLNYSILAHISAHIFMQLVLSPIFL